VSGAQISNPMEIAIAVHRMARHTLAPMLEQFERDRWPADIRRIVLNALAAEVAKELGKCGHG